MTARIAVVADQAGWRLAELGQQERFESRREALGEAMRRAGVARWRGEGAEVLAQDGPGEALRQVDLGPEPSRPADHG